MGWFHSITNHISDAGRSMGADIASTGEQAARSTVARSTVSLSENIGDDSAQAFSSPGSALLNVIESNGIEAGADFLEGVKAAGKIGDEGMVDTGRGLVALGKYPPTLGDEAIAAPLTLALSLAMKHHSHHPPTAHHGPDVQAQLHTFSGDLAKDIKKEIPLSMEVFGSVQDCSTYITCIVNKQKLASDLLLTAKGHKTLQGYLMVLLSDVIIDGKIIKGCPLS